MQTQNREKSFDSNIWDNLLKRYMIIKNGGYLNFTQSNSTIVSVILLFRFMQMISILSVDMITKNLKSIFHVDAYANLFPSFKFKGLFDGYTSEAMLTSLVGLLVLNLIIFYMLHILLMHFTFLSFVKIIANGCIMTLVLFNNLMTIPLSNVASEVILDNIYHSFSFSLIFALISIPLVFLSIFTVDIFSYDFSFNSKKILTYKNTLIPYAIVAFNFITVLLQNWHITDKRDELKVGNLIFSMITCLFLFYDEYNLSNFSRYPTIEMFYDIGLCLLLVESSYSVFIFVVNDFPSLFDIDLLSVSVFWTSIKIFRNLKAKIIEHYMEIDLFSDANLIHVDNICRILLAYNEEEEINSKNKFLIISIVREHNLNCKNKQCPCWTMVVKKKDEEDYRFASKTQADLGYTDDAPVGVADEDLPSKIKSQKLREMLEQQKQNQPTTIEINTEKIHNFVKYIYDLRGLSDFESTIIFMSSITFLNDYAKDYVGSIQRVFYHKQKISERNGKLKIYQSFMLENLRSIIDEILITKRRKHCENIFNLDCKDAVRYQQYIEEIKDDMKILSFMLKNFYSLLMRKNFDLGGIMDHINELIIKKNRLDVQYKLLLRTFRMNKELLINYYYYKHFLLFDDMGLKEYEESLKQCFRYSDTFYMSDNHDVKFSTHENLKSDTYIVMLKVTEENILIHYVSPNCLNLFEVLSNEDIINKSINGFMPQNIAIIHDQLLRSYLTKKVKTIFKDFYFETFLITKRLNLKEVLLTRVMEFTDENYLYLASAIKIKESKYSRVLTGMDGTILATNKMSNSILNINSLNRGACVFNYMPQTFWKYYKYDTYEESNTLECSREDIDENDYFILEIDKSYNDKEVFVHLMEQAYPGISFEKDSLLSLGAGDRDEIIVFSRLDMQKYISNVMKISFGKIYIKNYFYSQNLGLKLIEIQKAYRLEPLFLEFYKEHVNHKDELVLSASFHNMAMSYMFFKLDYMKSGDQDSRKYEMEKRRTVKANIEHKPIVDMQNRVMLDLGAKLNHILEQDDDDSFAAIARNTTNHSFKERIVNMDIKEINSLKNTLQMEKVGTKAEEAENKDDDFIKMLEEEKNKGNPHKDVLGGSVASQSTDFMQSELRIRIQRSNAMSQLLFWYLTMIGLIASIILVNTIITYLFNSNLNNFGIYFKEMNDLINVYSPLTYFHLQFSKYYATVGRDESYDIFDNKISSEYFNTLNQELDFLFNKSYINKMFTDSQEVYTLTLEPYNLITDSAIKTVPKMNLVELFFELNYRIKFYTKAFASDGKFNYKQFSMMDNHEYIINFYNAENVGFSLSNVLSDENTKIITNINLVSIVIMGVYALMAFAIALILTMIDTTTIGLLNRILHLFTMLKPHILKKYEGFLENNTNFILSMSERKSKTFNLGERSKGKSMAQTNKKDSNEQGSSIKNITYIKRPSFLKLLVRFVFLFSALLSLRVAFGYYVINSTSSIIGKGDKLKIITNNVIIQFITFANFYDNFHHTIQGKLNGQPNTSSVLAKNIEEFTKTLNTVSARQTEILINNDYVQTSPAFVDMLTSNFCNKLQELDPEIIAECLSLEGGTKNANYRPEQIFSREYVDNLIESSANYTDLVKVFSGNTVRNERRLRFIQKALILLFKEKVNQTESDLKYTAKVTLYDAGLCSLLVIVVAYLFGVRNYSTSRRKLDNCKSSFLVLPDELLSTNTYILKFFDANTKLMH